MENLYAVIMAGGVGSRFWPASRAKNPKQLLDLTGEGKTMIAATVERMLPSIPIDRILVVTGVIIKDAVQKALPELPPANILAEPVGRNTAPCIGWAAVHIMKINPEGIMAVMPSDHLVKDIDKFTNHVRLATQTAKSGSLVTFGIKPTSPETGFGYIETEKNSKDVKKVMRFVEKPDYETACRYLEDGNFSWNSGMFFFPAKKIIEEIKSRMPGLWEGLEKIYSAESGEKTDRTVKDVYPNLPEESIDYGIMEVAQDIKCINTDMGWSDVGSWSAAYDLSEKDENLNSIKADTISVDSEGCFVSAPENKTVSLVGVSDLVIVDTGDSLLVCNREKTQDVKKIVKELKKRKRFDLL